MRNKRLLWCVAAGVFLLAAGFTVFVFVHVLPDRITPENCDRIEVGMSLEEVEAILGGPADLEDDHADAGIPLGPSKTWVGEQSAVVVSFEPSGRVSGWWLEAPASEVRRLCDLPEPTFWQKLRRSLGW